MHYCRKCCALIKLLTAHLIRKLLANVIQESPPVVGACELCVYKENSGLLFSRTCVRVIIKHKNKFKSLTGKVDCKSTWPTYTRRNYCHVICSIHISRVYTSRQIRPKQLSVVFKERGRKQNTYIRIPYYVGIGKIQIILLFDRIIHRVDGFVTV